LLEKLNVAGSEQKDVTQKIHKNQKSNAPISAVKTFENQFRGWHGMLPVGSTYRYLFTRTCIERTFNGRYLFVDTRILTPNSREHHPFPRVLHYTSTDINHGLRHHILTIDRLNHCDSVVLPPPTITPTISRSGANDVEVVACLLHSVGRSKGDDAHATTTFNHLTPILC
jgi:hypothetical protein